MPTSTTTKQYSFDAEALEKMAMKEVVKDLEHSNGLPSPKGVNIWWDDKDIYVSVVIERIE